MTVLSAIGILLCFILLIFGAWKKASMFLVAVIGSGIIAVLSGLNVAETITGPYMQGFTSFVSAWIVVISLGSLLGNLYGESGAAWRIGEMMMKHTGPKWGLLVYIAVGALLVYSGIQVPVTLFVLLPFAKIIFPLAGIPWYLFPGITGLATATFAMGFLPGSLQIINLIPAQAFGLTPMSAPVEGIVATVFILVVGVLYINYEVKKGKDDPEGSLECYTIGGASVDEEKLRATAPKFVVSLIPMLVTLVLINIVHVNLIYGLAIGCILAIAFFHKSIVHLPQCLANGFNGGVMPCVLVSSVVGLGSVISATPVFGVIQQSVIHLPIPGLLKIAAITTIMAGITASASGGLKLTMELFGKQFLSWGFPPTIIHRVAAIASGGLDSLPWNGSIVMMFSMSGVGYSKGYKAVFVLTVLLPMLSSIVAIITYHLTQLF